MFYVRGNYALSGLWVKGVSAIQGILMRSLVMVVQLGLE